jgi:predicted nuclease with TOPRIM domain
MSETANKYDKIREEMQEKQRKQTDTRQRLAEMANKLNDPLSQLNDPLSKLFNPKYNNRLDQLTGENK